MMEEIVFPEQVERVPVGPLGIVAMESSRELTGQVNRYLTRWRHEYALDHVGARLFPQYQPKSFLISPHTVRFGSGEGKGVLSQSVRGKDLYILADVGNYSCTYKMFGVDNRMSPDDHFQDIKRIIAAIGGKARRVTVVMPKLYEARQHRKSSRESLDCALALQELVRMGVDSILTFDAHDPRVSNAIPLSGFENIFPTYQIIKAMLRAIPDIRIHRDQMMVVSPDEGAMSRNLYYSNAMGLDLGMFYKRRDYLRVENGKNPIVAHEFLGESVEGKDILIIDDEIASGESVLDIAFELKKRGARDINVAVTFALFTEGIDKFQDCADRGIISKVFSTNLTYRRPELLAAPWYVDVNMSKFLAYLIDHLNHDVSIGKLLSPKEKINKLLSNYRSGLRTEDTEEPDDDWN